MLLPRGSDLAGSRTCEISTFPNSSSRHRDRLDLPRYGVRTLLIFGMDSVTIQASFLNWNEDLNWPSLTSSISQMHVNAAFLIVKEITPTGHFCSVDLFVDT